VSEVGPVFISGASGKTGKAVIAALVAKGLDVRGLVRDPAKASAVAALGAVPVAGDLDDPASLIEAGRDCRTFVHIGPPMDPREVEQTEAMLAAAHAVGASDFVYYSVMQPLRQEVDHHRRKLIAEALVVESGLSYTILQPCRYMQHLDAIWANVVANGVHAMPFSTEVRFSVVDLSDLADAVALVVTDRAHRYASYELAGPQPLSQEDMAATISDRIGRPVEARRIDPEVQAGRMAAGGAAPARVACALGMNRHYDAHGFLGNANVLRWLLGREPTAFAAYVARLTN
jgi:uncharacterized protein YbjT (DUF2867 family)